MGLCSFHVLLLSILSKDLHEIARHLASSVVGIALFEHSRVYTEALLVNHLSHHIIFIIIVLSVA